MAPGLPGLRAAGHPVAGEPGHELPTSPTHVPVLKAAASMIWQGWSLGTYPDQPVWSNTVVTGLVADKSLGSLMQPFGNALAQAAQAAGYQVGQ